MRAKSRCAWCSSQISDDQPMGRRKRYCSQGCRQRAYEKRRQMTGGGTAEQDAGSVLVRRTELVHLQDRLYVLRSAVEVLCGAVQDDADKEELTGVAREVIAAAADLDKLWITP